MVYVFDEKVINGSRLMSQIPFFLLVEKTIADMRWEIISTDLTGNHNEIVEPRNWMEPPKLYFTSSKEKKYIIYLTHNYRTRDEEFLFY